MTRSPIVSALILAIPFAARGQNPTATINVDLKVVFANIDNQPVWQYLNICNLKKIKLQYDAMSQIPTASYDD